MWNQTRQSVATTPRWIKLSIKINFKERIVNIWKIRAIFQSWWGWRLLTTTKHEWLWLKYFTHSVIIDVHHLFSLLHPTKIQHHSIEGHSISLKRPLSSPLLYCRCYSSLYNLALSIIISLTPRFFRVQRNEEMEENDEKLSSDVNTKKWRVRVSTYEGLSS